LVVEGEEVVEFMSEAAEVEIFGWDGFRSWKRAPFPIKNGSFPEFGWMTDRMVRKGQGGTEAEGLGMKLKGAGQDRVDLKITGGGHAEHCCGENKPGGWVGIGELPGKAMGRSWFMGILANGRLVEEGGNTVANRVKTGGCDLVDKQTTISQEPVQGW
jgi:hypothetical protein